MAKKENQDLQELIVVAVNFLNVDQEVEKD